MQLGKGDNNLPQSFCHQSLSLRGADSLMVVEPCAWLRTPAVTKSQ